MNAWIEGQIDGKTERCILNLHGYKQRKMIEILTLCWHQEITVEIPAICFSCKFRYSWYKIPKRLHYYHSKVIVTTFIFLVMQVQ